MRLTLPLTIALAVFAGAGKAAAEPYALVPPSALDLDFEGHTFRFVGEGFDIGHHPMSVGVYFPLVRNPSCDPCAVGDTHDPSFRTAGEAFLGNGRGTVAGMTYHDIAFFGTLNLTATPVTFAAVPGDRFDLQTPFTFDGVIRGIVGGEQVFLLSLIGSGRALRSFDYSSDLDLYFAGENRPMFLFDSATDQAPVPEPATLLLFATGTAVAALRRRRWH